MSVASHIRRCGRLLPIIRLGTAQLPHMSDAGDMRVQSKRGKAAVDSGSTMKIGPGRLQSGALPQSAFRLGRGGPVDCRLLCPYAYQGRGPVGIGTGLFPHRSRISRYGRVAARRHDRNRACLARGLKNFAAWPPIRALRSADRRVVTNAGITRMAARRRSRSMVDARSDLPYTTRYWGSSASVQRNSAD